MRKVHLIKFIDRWLGNALALSLPKPLPPPQNLSRLRSVLLIRPGGIGDAVHLVPTIQALQNYSPDIVIDILAECRNCGVFDLSPGIRQVFCYDRPGQFLNVWRNCYDVVIDTEQWHFLSAVVARLVRAPLKIGIATNERTRLFTHAISYCQENYEVDSFLRLLEPLGIADWGKMSSDKWLRVPKDSERLMASLLPADNNRPIIVLFPGASITEKCWGSDRFRLVAEWCLRQELRVIVVGGKGDREEGQSIATGLDVLNLAGRTSLAGTAAILEHASCLVSGDSGLLHIAAGLGIPTVALFGPSSVAKWAPRGAQHITLLKADCSPCSRYGYTPECPHDVGCMSEITVPDVISAISRLMNFPANQG